MSFPSRVGFPSYFFLFNLLSAFSIILEYSCTFATHEVRLYIAQQWPPYGIVHKIRPHKIGRNWPPVCFCLHWAFPGPPCGRSQLHSERNLNGYLFPLKPSQRLRSYDRTLWRYRNLIIITSISIDMLLVLNWRVLFQQRSRSLLQL